MNDLNHICSLCLNEQQKELLIKNKKIDLVPIGDSTVLLWNRTPTMINKVWRKGRAEGADTLYVLDKPLRPTCGMIYQYAWGDYYFDIRDFREKGKFPTTEYPEDKQFKTPCKALFLVANQLAKIAEIQDLYAFMNGLLYSLDEQDSCQYINLQKVQGN